MQKVNSYLARSIIRHLNGDYKEFHRLRDTALDIYKEEEYDRRCLVTIGEVTSKTTKIRMHSIAKEGVN
jgi:hypothetical protein